MTSVSERPARPLTRMPPEIGALAASSVRVIAAAQTPEGAFPAADGFRAYAGYCWFRDGAFVADAMSAAGEVAPASRFFDWCAGVLDAWGDAVEDSIAAAASGSPLPGARMLPARFRYDGTAGEDEWWDFQLDGCGTWLWALVQHVDRHAVDPGPWRAGVIATVRYLLASWQRPCFDWWEEHEDHVHVSTLACILAGLRSVADAGLLPRELEGETAVAVRAIDGLIRSRGTVDGHLVKWLDEDAVDGSLAAAVGLLEAVPAEDPLAAGTIDAVERYLTVEGGTHRYLGDSFYGGGRWPLLSCFLGLAHLRRGDAARAHELLAWAASTAGTAGELPEQVDQHLIAPNLTAEWIGRWGPSARPLYWSHAMLLRLAVALDEADLA